MHKDVEYASIKKLRKKIERVRVHSAEREVYLCFDASKKRGIHVEYKDSKGQSHRINVVYYHKTKPDAKLSSHNINYFNGMNLFDGIQYERIGAEDGTIYCCRTFSGRRYCRIIKSNETCEGGVFSD